MAEELNLNGNAEIEEALKEFERQNAGQGGNTPGKNETVINTPVEAKTSRSVSGIQFEQETYQAPKFQSKPEVQGMAATVMKYSGGAFKEQRQAEYVLLVFVAVAMAISIFLFTRGGIGTTNRPNNIFKNVPLDQIPPALWPAANFTKK